jgi:hypothetical protein
VRESWAADAQVDKVKPSDLSKGEPIAYLADNAVISTGSRLMSQGKNRQSIFMPRWASRILLEVTDVRVERLQDITEEDAKAEGLKVLEYKENPAYTFSGAHKTGWGIPIGAFKALWQSINGADSWADNPWVWVVDFKVLEVK